MNKRLCVFCGSSMPADQRYQEAACRLGELMGQAGIDLVYGGGHIGLMGIVADAALAAGSQAIGVIPSALNSREVGHLGLSELIVVTDMHDRKKKMFELSDAVAVLPGGLGTLDEAFEALTLRQLHFFDKPIVLVDTDGFWQPLVRLIEHVTETGFARQDQTLYTVVPRPEDVIPACFPA
jgi:uncharacterized protein (TIGR00730 family)